MSVRSTFREAGWGKSGYCEAEVHIPGSQVAVGTKFCTLAPHVCGCSVQNLLLVPLLATGILQRLLDYWKVCAPLGIKFCKYFYVCGLNVLA